MNSRFVLFLRVCLLFVLVGGMVFQPQSAVYAAAVLSVEPITWNVIGLDSNNVNVGPNHFPVGAHVCNTSLTDTATNVKSAFVFDDGLNLYTGDPYINLRAGTLSAYTSDGTNLTPGACTDFYYEVAVTRSSNAYDKTRDYHITASSDGGTVTGSTPTPRELYVEHLVSQNRNAVTDVKYGTSLASLTSVAAGGTMNLMVGNTYYIQLVGFTATQGYEQLESFINIPNTIFQINSVSTSYSAPTPHSNPRLYADACTWENDPNSPNYRSCLLVGKEGGDITVTYQVTILQVPTSPLVNPVPLSTLIYDFSGSSYHYNADFSVSTRYANIINASIAKSFSPKTILPGGTSTLTFTITNPGTASISSVNFSDTLPNNVSFASTSITYTGCGSPSPSALTVGGTSVNFSNITVSGNSTCTIAVSVTSSTTGTYNNTTSNLLIGTTDTGSSGSDTLIVSSQPAPPSSCTTSTTLATWNFNSLATGANIGPFTGTIPVGDASGATATYGSGTGSSSGIANSTSNTFPGDPSGFVNPVTQTPDSNSWGIHGGWPVSGTPTGTTTPYFQFQINAGNYGGLTFTAGANLGGSWSNGDNWYVLTSTDGTTWTQRGTGAWATNTFKNNWGTVSNNTSTPANAGTTYFRVYFVGSQSGKTDPTVFLDNVSISGCARPSVPTLSKSFSPTSIGTGSTSTLTFTFTNPNATALTGVGFTDVLPSGLLIATPNGLTQSCSPGTFTSATITATAGTSTITVSGGILSANAICAISVNILGNAAGSYTNVSSSISSTDTGPNLTSSGIGTASLTVIDPPVINKAFTANPIFTGNSTALTFTINNPNTAITLTNVSFTDDLTFGGTQSGLVVATPNGLVNNCTGSTVTAVAGSTSISMSGLSLAAGASCTLTVNVTGTTAGLKNNSVTVSSTNGGTGNTSTADVLVRDPSPAINLLKQVGSSASGPWSSFLTATVGDPVYYKFYIENTGDILLNPVSVTDPDSVVGPLLAGCTWYHATYGPGPTYAYLGDAAITPTLQLPAATAGVDPSAYCIVGPITGGAVSGSHTNTATASGTGGSIVTKSDSATYGTPALTLVKSVTPTSFRSAVVDTLNYSYLVTNSGFAPLLGPVTVTDDKATVTCPAVTTVGDLDTWFDVGESLTCTATYTITAGDVTAGSVTNTATATADGVISNPDSETVYRIPDFTVSKTNNVSGSVPQNGTFNWTITVSQISTGQGTFADTQTILSDTLPGAAGYYGLPTVTNGATPPTGTINCSIVGTALTCVASGAVTFPAGASFSVTFAVTPTAAGSLANTATVDPTIPPDPDGNLTELDETNNSSSDTVFVTNPSFTIAKVADVASVSAAGNVITYMVTLTNTGNVPLTGVSASDPLLANLDCDGVAGAPFTTTGLTIPVSGTLTCTGTYTVTQTDIDNNGGGDGDIDNTVTGDTNETPLQTASATVAITQTPAHTTVKTETSTGLYAVGNTITYNIVVTNTGNITLTGVTVIDNSTTVGTCTPAQPSTLAPNATMTCPASHVVTQADVDSGSYANTATGDSNQTPPSTSTVTITFLQNPAHTTLKSETSTGPYAVGNTITYDIVVTNTGNITLTGVTVSDNSATVGVCTPAQPSTLAPNASMTCLASHVVTQADVNSGSYVNTATGDTNQTPPSTSTLTVTFPQNPAHTTLKSETSTGPYTVGDTITYNIVVTNTGNVTLTGVTVSDNSATVGICTPAQPATLVPNASMTCPASHVVTQADVDSGSYANTATGDSNQTPPSSSTVTITFSQNPAHTTVKSITSTAPYGLGDTITYDIVVTNTGNVTLTGVTVTDNSATVGTCTPAQPSTLAPNAVMTCPASHVVTLTDLTNGSYVNTATGDSNQTPPNSSTVTVSLAASFTMVKNASVASVNAAGDVINYTVVLTNTGNVTLTGVSVTDPLLSDLDCDGTAGAPFVTTGFTVNVNSALTCTGSYAATQNDLDTNGGGDGDVDNTVTGDTNETPAQSASATVAILQAPAHTTAKSETSTGPYVVGNTITYDIVVTNTGNVTLTGVTVTDNSAVVGTCTPAQPSTLAPNATMTCPASHVVTQTDINTGNYVNTATGDSNQTPPGTSTVTVNFTQSPAHTTVKSETSTGPYTVGDTITYNIVVTNTGNITLTSVTVSDNSAIVGTCTPAQPSSLAPNATMTCPASHIVTATDISNSSYVNTATGDSNETAPNTSTVTVSLSPALVADPALSKAGNPTQATVGETVTFTLTATNAGNIPAPNVVITDTLPVQFDVVTVTSVYQAGGNAGTISVSSAPAPYTVTVNLGTLNVTDVVTIIITTTVNSLGNPPINNTANVSTSATSDIAANNADSVTIALWASNPNSGSNRPTLLPATGFAPNVETKLPSQPQDMMYSATDVLLEIPSLGIKIPIVGVPKKNGTWDVSWLGKQAGWLEGSAFPSWSGNSVLTSHVYTSNGLPGPFVNLNRLKYGDQIIVHAYGQKYIFEIQTNQVVAPNDTSAFKHEEKPWLTLITCKEYDEKTNSYQKRVVVRAVLVKVVWDK